ncbi:MAG: ribbon-helix-helix protein, CopG family [Nodosilinea sp. WJT8-NPBG4]|nr:ribbon-helix-helix protein, CopG family [Nodosilinea sp. WJT8-NPBG4]
MQPIPEDDSMARLQVDIDEELKTRLKLHAVRQDKTMSDIVELAVAAYLDKVEKAGK